MGFNVIKKGIDLAIFKAKINPKNSKIPLTSKKGYDWESFVPEVDHGVSRLERTHVVDHVVGDERPLRERHFVRNNIQALVNLRNRSLNNHSIYMSGYNVELCRDVSQVQAVHENNGFRFSGRVTKKGATGDFFFHF